MYSKRTLSDFHRGYALVSASVCVNVWSKTTVTLDRSASVYLHATSEAVCTSNNRTSITSTRGNYSHLVGAITSALKVTHTTATILSSVYSTNIWTACLLSLVKVEILWISTILTWCVLCLTSLIKDKEDRYISVQHCR